MFEADNVGVVHHLHDLQLPVFEALILEDLLDRNLAERTKHVVNDVFLRSR